MTDTIPPVPLAQLSPCDLTHVEECYYQAAQAARYTADRLEKCARCLRSRSLAQAETELIHAYDGFERMFAQMGSAANQ